jgi:hypothetical protein
LSVINSGPRSIEDAAGRLALINAAAQNRIAPAILIEPTEYPSRHVHAVRKRTLWASVTGLAIHVIRARRDPETPLLSQFPYSGHISFWL